MNRKTKPKSALIPMYLIAPCGMQPRKYFDEKRLEELKNSIEKYGLIHPVTVRSAGHGEFELIAGERRFRACELAGMTEIPAIIVNADDKASALMSLEENMSREGLIFTERANCVNSLMDTYKFSREELAKELGISLAEISLYRKYADMPLFAQKLIREYELTDKHIAAVLQLKEPERQIEAVQKICLNSLDPKQSMQMVKAMKENRKRIRRLKSIPTDERFFKNTLRRALDIVRKGGIDADMSESETENGTEIKIVLKKEQSIIKALNFEA
jgi:ParB family chromosome partitioning protein